MKVRTALIIAIFDGLAFALTIYYASKVGSGNIDAMLGILMFYLILVILALAKLTVAVRHIRLYPRRKSGQGGHDVWRCPQKVGGSRKVDRPCRNGTPTEDLLKIWQYGDLISVLVDYLTAFRVLLALDLRVATLLRGNRLNLPTVQFPALLGEVEPRPWIDLCMPRRIEPQLVHDIPVEQGHYTLPTTVQFQSVNHLIPPWAFLFNQST